MRFAEGSWYAPPPADALPAITPMLTRRALVAALAALGAARLSIGRAHAATFPGADGLERLAEDLARQPFGATWRTLVDPGRIFSGTPSAPGAFNFVPLSIAPEFDHLTEVFTASAEPELLVTGAFELTLAAEANAPPEVFQFLGATLFRMRAAAQNFGVAARGLSIRTADPRGEEIPIFSAIWIGMSEDGGPVQIHALLDTAATTGAYRMVVRPGPPPTIQVEATLFPREALRMVGIAPLTATFLHAAGDGQRADDWRPSVHEARGLLMLNGRGERLWRTLTNPSTLQISAFADRTPRAFGLVQRDRRSETFMDTAARWENRPSMIVEPEGDWGPGWVVLVEIPSRSETNDNVQVFWQPEMPLPQLTGFRIRYRLVAADDAGPAPPSAVVDGLRTGDAGGENGAIARTFVLDYRPMPELGAGTARQAQASVRVSAGVVRDIVVQQLPDRRLRTRFVVERTGDELVELRADLFFPDAPPAEVWLHRWS